LPTTQAERQLWSIWLGYLTACILVSLVSWKVLEPGEPLDELRLYPLWSILTGLAFFIMGSSYWGWCYAIGVGFFGLALLMTQQLHWAALEFGMGWAAALVVLGLYLHRLGATVRDGKKEGKSSRLS
jgi:serine/threonine-protein kinase